MKSRNNDVIEVYPEIINEGFSEKFNEVDAGADTGYGERILIGIINDGSESMNLKNKNGKRSIDELNESRPLLKSELENNELVEACAEITEIVCSGNTKVINEFSKISDLKFPEIIAGGNTPCNQSILKMYDLIVKRIKELQKQGISVKAPTILVSTDGFFTDPELQSAALEMIERYKESITFIPIGTSTADFDGLKKYAINQPVLELLNADFSEMFKWLGRSIELFSQSRPGQQLMLPPANCFRPITA